MSELNAKSAPITPSATTVCVMGLGYIGLPTASILANKGFHVLGVDVRPEVVQTINQGRIHIEEPDLDILVRSAVNSGQLKAANEPQPADVFILCVPTPICPDHSPDLSYVEKAARAIRPHVRAGNLVVLESTSPPRTTEKIVVPQAIPPELIVGRDVYVAHCPERVLPGRILLGSSAERSGDRRYDAGLCPTCPAILRDLRPRRNFHHQRDCRGDYQANRKFVPRREHRLCERIVDAI